MKIALIGDASSPLFARLVARLAGRHAVCVITLDPPAVQLENVKYFVHGRWTAKFPRSIRYGLSAIPISLRLRSLDVEVTHAHYAWGYGLVATATRSHPRIVSVWGSDVLVSGVASPVHRWLTRKVLRSADAVCATSPHLAHVVAKIANVDAIVTPFGVDTDRFAPSSHDGPVTIGMVKRLDRNSGVATLLTAIRMLIDQHPSIDLRVRIVGRHPAGTKWRSNASSMGLSHAVDWRDQVDPASVPQELNQMDIFVQVSEHTEGYGVAVLEAQSCGIPVIVSDVGGLPDIVLANRTGLVIPANDPDALSDALDRLISDERLRKQMGDGARSHVVEHYGSGVASDVFESLYERLGIK